MKDTKKKSCKSRPLFVSTGTTTRKRKRNKKLAADSVTGRLRKKRVKRGKEPKSQSRLTDERFSSVYVHPSGRRVPFSVRIDSAIKEAWMRFIFEKGLSSCEIVEKTFLGIMAGYEAPVYASHTINVVVDFPRVVKRVRRRQIYYEDEIEVTEEGISPRDVQPEIRCHFCSRAAVGLAESVQGIRVFVCDVHQRELQQHKKWRVL